MGMGTDVGMGWGLRQVWRMTGWGGDEDSAAGTVGDGYK